MKNLFVPFRIAKTLKALGFDEPCLTYYYEDGTMSDILSCDRKMEYFTNSKQGEWKPFGASAPHYLQAQDWLRKNHDINIDPYRTVGKEGVWYYFFVNKGAKHFTCQGAFDYYTALNNAIELALKHIK